jgi:signal peptidase
MKIINWIVTIILIIVIGGLGFIYLSPDYDILLVKSQSMEPNINMGDMIVTGPVDGPINPGIEPGKVITFQMGKGLVTHRVLELNGATIRTKGDALEDPDSWQVDVANVKGVLLFRIPYIGYMNNFVRTKNGWFIAIIIPAFLLVLFIVKDIIKEAFSNEY